MSAHAQATGGSAEAAPAGAVEEVVVTASRINRAGFVAPTPTTVIGIEEAQKTATTNIADLLNTQIPSLLPSNRPQDGGTGTANAGANFLNLRGLGAMRTLVLVDGQRYVPTSSTGSINTNVVPSSLIDHVDVVTGGASAAWGSDAVAGVVNFVYRKNYEGLEGSVQGGETTYGDEKQYDATLLAGRSFLDGRFHVMLAGEYFNNDGIPREDARPLGRQGWTVIANPAFTATNGQPARLIEPNVTIANESVGGLINGGPLKGLQFGPGGTTSQFIYGTSVGTSFMVGGSGPSLGPSQVIEPSVNRYAVVDKMSFDVASNLSASLELSRAYSNVISKTIPPNDSNLTIRNDNAFLPASVKAQMAAAGVTSVPFGRVAFDIGLMIIDIDTTTDRAVAGLNGSFGKTWKWNFYFEDGRTKYYQKIHNTQITANYTMAIDSVVNPATGQIVCRSTLTNPTNGCVPLNLFGEGSPSAAAKAYVTGEQWALTYQNERASALNVQGEPFSTWAGPVSVAAGAEYRYEDIVTTADPLAVASAYRLGNVQPLQGNTNLWEVFGETVVPLLSERPFAKSLEFNGAVRTTNYSTSGQVTTWKLGLSYVPVDGIRFRSTRSHDIRAPNLSELFTSTQQTVATIIDPRNNGQKQIFILRSGNTDLTPEVADTTSYGVVLTPRWLSGFQASIDTFNINIANAISTLAPQDIINFCNSGSTDLCPFVIRDPNSGLITTVRTPNINLQRLYTSGVDTELSYNFDLASLNQKWPGHVSTRLLTTYVKELVTDSGTTHKDAAGDDGSGVPHWRANLNLTYTLGDFDAFVSGQYVGGGKYDATVPDSAINFNRIPSRTYWDAAVEYVVFDQDHRRLQLFAHVKNLFNTAPPVDPGSSTQNIATNSSLFDTIGRAYTVGIRFKY